jgi:hypothetical protein
MMDARINWLLGSDAPWTRYRTMVDLLNLPEESVEVRAARKTVLDHPQIQGLIEDASSWPGYALKRHNDAKQLIYKISTLADFGLNTDDPGLMQAINRVTSHQSPDGAFETLVFIPKAFGGSNQDIWAWILCDSPTLLYSLIAMGLDDQPFVKKAVEHLAGLVEDNGWRCTASPELGKFRGPGRKSDPCPIANVYALKAISQFLGSNFHQAAHKGTEMLLHHWQIRKEKKFYLFGMGTDFSKLKYPFVWYDILHVVDVLSQYSWVHSDPRFQELVKQVIDQADTKGRYTASSMYRAWKGWSFADKKHPSPWLTFLVLRIQKRTGLSIQ